MKLDIIVKSILFNDSNKVLILHRSELDTARPGEVDLPGGGSNSGEDIIETAVREAREEIGVSLSLTELRVIYTKTSLEDEGNPRIRVLCVGKMTDENIILSIEHDDYHWSDIDDAIAMFRGREWGRGIEFAQTNGLLPS